MAAKTYVSVAQHAITPLDGVVAPGDPVTLDETAADPYVKAGQLVETAAPAPDSEPVRKPKPDPAAHAGADNPEETPQ